MTVTSLQRCVRMHRRHSSSVILLAVVALLAPFAIASDGSDSTPATGELNQRYMFNWGTQRETLAANGLTFDMQYWSYALGAPRHPEETDPGFGAFQRIRATVDFDFGKRTSAKGLKYHVTGLWQTGQNMGSQLGSIVNPNSIASYPQFRLDSMWLSQSLLHDKVQITAGLLASRDFFGLWGGPWFNEAMSYSFGNLGNVRASADPATGPGAELRVALTKRVMVRTGYFLPSTKDFDANGKVKFPTGFNYEAGSTGATSGTAVDIATAPGSQYNGSVEGGFIYNGGRFFDYKSGSYDSNFLVYTLVKQPVYRVSNQGNRGLDLHFGLTSGPASKAENPTEASVGAMFNGPIAARPHDTVGAALVYSSISDNYNSYVKSHPSVNALCGTAGCDSEKLFELTYTAQLAPWLHLQPVYQYISHVGGRKNGSAGLGGVSLRAEF